MSMPRVLGLAADLTSSIFKAVASRAGLPTHATTQAQREVLKRGSVSRISKSRLGSSRSQLGPLRNAVSQDSASTRPRQSTAQSPSAPVPEAQSPQWRIIQPAAPSIPTSPSPGASRTDEGAVSEQLRALMRLVPHSVVVCTTCEPRPDAPPAPRAMTLSSFTTLALRPTPLVNFNVTTPSRTLSALEKSRRFNIHLLRGGIEGAKVADWFARGNAEGSKVFEGLTSPASRALNGQAEPQAVQREGRSGPEPRPGTDSGPDCFVPETNLSNGPPVLQGKGVLSVLRCRLLDDAPLGGLFRVRDDVIVVGEVVEVLDGRSETAEPSVHDDFGLVYADRRYRRLGESMVKM